MKLLHRWQNEIDCTGKYFLIMTVNTLHYQPRC